VLIVEDGRASRTLLAQLVAEAGFSPVEAESAEDGLRLALTDPPGAAIVDQHLPGMGGADLVHLLHGSPDPRLARLPVVGLSGRGWTEHDLRAAGACCFVRKPVETGLLARALRWAVEVYGRPAVA
jgi:FixJ family two-component response regulator